MAFIVTERGISGKGSLLDYLQACLPPRLHLASYCEQQRYFFVINQTIWILNIFKNHGDQQKECYA